MRRLSKVLAKDPSSTYLICLPPVTKPRSPRLLESCAVARSPSRDERAPSPSRFSSLSLPPRIIDTERSLCLLSDDCSRHARIRAEKRNLPGISRFEGSPRAKQLDEIRHREEFYPASSWDPGLFALPRSLQVMGESGDKKGIKGEISSHGGQVSNGWIEEDSPEELGI